MTGCARSPRAGSTLWFGLGLRVIVQGAGITGSGFRVQGGRGQRWLTIMIGYSQGSTKAAMWEGSGVKGLGFRIQGFRVHGSEFKGLGVLRGFGPIGWTKLSVLWRGLEGGTL